MYIPRPSLRPLIAFQNLDTYLEEFKNIGNLSGGVAVYGSAAAYALVWELGSLRMKQPGPKTLWSVNRNDERAILTKQAPFGYVGYISEEFWPIIQEELQKVNYSSKDSRRMRLELEVALDNASHKIAELVRSFAPVDSGDLRSQIQGVDSDETSLLSTAISSESAGTLIV